MKYEARFVVDTHTHITTLYQPKGQKGLLPPDKIKDWRGLGQLVQTFDNSPLCLYDMDRYGIDMCLLKPSMPGTTNEMQAALVDKYPDKFRAFCADQTLKLKVAQGEAKWTLDDAADEVEKALQTDKFIGIGEFVPKDPDPEKNYTFKERLIEYRTFAELARKYGVTLDFHDFVPVYEWDAYHLLRRVAREYPDVNIIFCHSGYSIGAYVYGEEIIKKACGLAGMCPNVYLETGNWPAEYYPIALNDPNVGPTRLIWGGDYGHVPQYIMPNPGGNPPSYASVIRKFPSVPYYQIDWWGWAMHQIRKVKEWVTQDEINLILGGNAAKIFKLPVPYERMFMAGRPDIFGIHWDESIPYIPDEQVINKDEYEDS
ncbi:MAG: amidohydrolase [Deltaproteobacteria bacterium]|nr:amidohydrolase [Deltaproteobacteria bacterium]